MSERPSILFVGGGLPPPYGGISKFFSLLLPGLVERGFEVHLQLRPRGEIIAAYQAYIDRGIHIHDVFLPDQRELYYGYRLLNILLANPKLFWGMKQAAYVDFLLRKRVALRHLMATSHMLATEEVAQRYPIDIVHAHEDPLYYGTVGTGFRKSHPLTKYIHTVFGVVFPYTEQDRYPVDSHLFKGLVRHILDQADLLLSLTRHCARTVEDVDLDPARVKVIAYTVDGDRFSPDVDPRPVIEKHNLEDNKIVLFMGQVRPRKGPQVLIEAAPFIFEQCPGSRLIFVGPGDFTAELQAKAVTLGCEDKIIFTGEVDEADLPAYFAACDVFVFPSCTPIECLGLVMIQAMFCAKPVVASNIGGIPEVVVDGETGFLVPPLQPNLLAEKVVTLLQNPGLTTQMGSRGRKRAMAVFDLEKIVDNYERMYLEVWKKHLKAVK